MCLNRSNIQIDRKILANLAVNEPYSFKAVLDEIVTQNEFTELDHQKPRIAAQRGIPFDEALAQGKMRAGGPPTAEELKEMEEMMVPKDYQMYGLRFPERDARTPADYLRVSYKEEDEAFLAEQSRKTITTKEQKRLPREVLTDQWEEDMSLYKHKRKQE